MENIVYYTKNNFVQTDERNFAYNCEKYSSCYSLVWQVKITNLKCLFVSRIRETFNQKSFNIYLSHLFDQDTSKSFCERNKK